MNLIEIKEVGYKAYMPSCLAECDTRQYVMMSRLLYAYNIGEIKSLDQFYGYAVYALLNVKTSKKKHETSDEKKHENLALLSTLVEPFFEVNENEQLQIVQDYTNNPIPYFYLNGIKYEGPANHFQDVTFGQYMDGLTKSIEFHEYQEIKDLFELTAIFYKPSFFGYQRTETPKRVLKRMVQLVNRELDIGFVYGFYLFFTSMNQFITGAVVPYEGREIDLSIIFESDSSFKSDLPGLGIRSTMYSIAQSGVFGTEEMVRKKPLWDVIFHLYDLKKEHLDQKKMSEQTKSNDTP